MDITTTICLTIVVLLTTSSLIKCEGDHDNDTEHKLQLIEPFSDHLDYLDHLDHFDELNDVQSNKHGPTEQFQINALQSSNLDDPILNNNLNKVIQRFEVIHHDGDSVTKYETTSHANHEESDELFDDPLIFSLQSSTTPNAYTKIIKKTVFKQNQNGEKNSLESIQPVESTYNNNNAKEVGIDNSMSKTQYMPQIDHMKNIEMSASSQQITDLPGKMKNTVQTKVANISTSDGKSNDLNEPIERKYNVDSIPSNNIKLVTSSSNSNYNGGVRGSLQSHPMKKDDNTNIISKTKIIGQNRSKGRPLKRISRKLRNLSNGKKIITKYQGNKNDRSDSNEYDHDHNTEKMRSSNIIIPSTSFSNSNYNGGITGSLQSYPMGDGNIKKIYKTEMIDNTGSNSKPIQNIPRKPGRSFKGKKTIVKKYQDDENDDNDFDEFDKDRNTDKIRSINNIIPKTSSLNSNYNGGITGSLQSYPMGDGNIKKIYKTEMIDNTGSNSKPIQNIPRKPGRSFKGKKTIVKKYQDNENDDNDFDEYDKDRNTDKIRSTNNIIPKTSSLNSNYNGGITGSLQSYPMGENDKIKKIYETKIIDNTSSNSKPIKKIPRKPGRSFKGKQMEGTKYQDYENDDSDLDEFNIDHDTKSTTFSTTGITKNNISNGNSHLRTSLKPESSFKGEKEIIIKYQDVDDDYSDLDEHDVFDIAHNIERIRSSNNILPTTSSLNSNYFDGATDSLQSYPMRKDGEMNTISTSEIIDKNSSNGLPIYIQRISHKPVNLFKDDKAVITKYQGDDNDLSGLNEHSIDINVENTGSSNNIVSKLNPSGYNKIITTTSTTTTDRDNMNNDLLESNIKPNMNYELTYSLPQLNQGVSNNLVSSGQSQTEIIKQQESSDESNNDDSNGKYNKAERIDFQNSNTNSNNNMISLFDNDIANYVPYYMRPSGASMFGNYESSMKTNGDKKNVGGLRKKKSKSSRKKKSKSSENTVQGGSSKKMRSKNKSYSIRNGNGINGGLQRNMNTNSRSSKQLSGIQSSRSNFKMNLPRSSSFSKSYSYDSPIQYETQQSCSCNNGRKLSKRQSSESNENNYSKDFTDSESISVKYYIDMDNQPMHYNGEKIIELLPPLEPSYENSDSPSLSPSLSLLQQVSSSPLPPPPPTSFAPQSDQKLTYTQSDQSADFNDLFNQYVTDKLANTAQYKMTNIKQDFKPPGPPKPPRPFGPPGTTGLQMNPFVSLVPPRDEHLALPPYPYAYFQHFSSGIPVVISLEGTSLPLRPELIEVLSGQEKQVEVNSKLVQTQQDNDVSDSRNKEISTLNSESVAANTQSNLMSNTNNSQIIEYTKTIKTTENTEESGIPEVHIVETQFEAHNDFTDAISNLSKSNRVNYNINNSTNLFDNYYE